MPNVIIAAGIPERVAVGLAAVLIISLFGCGDDKTSQPEHSAPEVIALPYAESFDGQESEIQQRWSYAYAGAPAMAQIVSVLTEEEFATAPRGMEIGCAVGETNPYYNGYFYYGGGLRLNRDIDLTGLQSARLTFLNRRSVVSTVQLPAWQQGRDNDSRCRVQLSVDSGETWADLAVYSSAEQEWTFQSVSLDGAAGQSGVRIAFVLLSHAAAGTSTTWWIDDVALSAE